MVPQRTCFGAWQRPPLGDCTKTLPNEQSVWTGATEGPVLFAFGCGDWAEPGALGRGEALAVGGVEGAGSGLGGELPLEPELKLCTLARDAPGTAPTAVVGEGATADCDRLCCCLALARARYPAAFPCNTEALVTSSWTCIWRTKRSAPESGTAPRAAMSAG